MKKLPFFLVLLTLGLSSAGQDPVEILEKMQDLTRGDKSYSEVTMQIVRPRYTREVGMRSWAMGDDYSLILITAPARDRGIGYLKREREIWNRIPSIDRLIKLPPGMMSQSWMGSDFSNDDLVRESSVIHDYTHRHLGMEETGGYRCHKLELIPKPDKPIVWGKVLVWVAEGDYYQIRTEQYDERDNLVNVITFSEVKTLGDRKLPSRMKLVPQDKKGHATVLITEVMDFNPTLDTDFFSIQNLQRMR